jgi:hypothetical protein
VPEFSASQQATLIVDDYAAATGIALICAYPLQYYDSLFPSLQLGDAYYSIALALNALLTLMLITRLVLHRKNIRRALGHQDRPSGLYKGIITMLVESGALYAASFVLFFGPWASASAFQLVTFQTLPEVQVRTVFPLP